MIFDKIFFKVLKIKWVLIKVVGGVGAVGVVPRFVGGGSSQRDSKFLERGLKIEIKNFAKGVAGEAIKTFGKV